jgi:hypothetical protein
MIMDFGEALDYLKNGVKITRDSWNLNDSGRFVMLQRAYPNGIGINQNTADATGFPEGTMCKFLPYLMLCTGDKTFVPWVPDVIDILAEDWDYVYD